MASTRDSESTALFQCAVKDSGERPLVDVKVALTNLSAAWDKFVGKTDRTGEFCLENSENPGVLLQRPASRSK